MPPAALYPAAAAIVAAVLVWLLMRVQRSRLQERLSNAESARQQAEAEGAEAREGRREGEVRIARLEAELEAERTRGEERLKDLEKARENLTNQFKSLANDILEDKSKRFTELNKENLDAIVKPLQERIGEFRKQVADTYDAESKARASLKTEINQLRTLHQQMSDDAQRLTSALKGESKAQGGWGEVILKRVFEASGLTEGREYELEVSVRSAGGGNLRPDAVVHLPEDRDMIVDAKVSLTAYERLHNAEDDEAREAALREHLRSVRDHIDRLSGKDYQALEGIDTPGFVLMFVAVEGAYLEAVRADNDLHDYALKRNVVLLSPSNMLPTLRVVEHMWRTDKQNRNAQIIADEAGKLYDKFVNFVGDVEEVGNRLEQAQAAYGRAENKLASGRGNLIGRTEKLRKLGAASNKRLDATRSGENALADDSDDQSSDEEHAG